MLGVVVLLLLCVSCVSVSSSFSFKNGSNEIIRCIDKERQALLTFRAGLRVIDDYASLPSWSSKDCCKWSEVECSNQTGHVITLDLKYSGLAGKISPSLLELRVLNYLDLSFVDFENRPIPKFFGSFTRLKHLNLGYCNFSGIIPSQLGNLSNLNYLDLSSDPSFNLSVENIDWLSPLSSLETLRMDGVDLSRATHWVDIIKTLPFLSFVSFRDCQLSKVSSLSSSSSINSSSSTSIKELDLSSNGFTSSMYSWLFKLSSSLFLQRLYLSHNLLESMIPNSFGNLSNLIYLHLSDNLLESMIPSSFGNLSNLIYLDLSDNLLESMIPNSFENLSNLTSLYMYNNNLSGNLSDFLDILSGSLPALERLDLGSNKLYGPLPDGIIRFSSLRGLYLSGNQLNGTITKNMGTLSQLDSLDLSYNSLTGTLSEAHFSNLSQLDTLYLSYNSLTGTLSEAHFSNLSLLTHLGLSGNALQIKVSPQWSPHFQLFYIELRSCNLGPLFPNWIRTQKNFFYLDISSNGISDSIPPWLWDLSTQDPFLNLSSNNFGGILPNLSSKMHQGFDLSSNHFEGPIPLFPSTSVSINLSRNKFVGNLDFLCQLSDAALSFLDISYNLLTGGLPDCLGKLEKLTIVNLAHNRLSGEIPPSIGSLFRLESLYLYNNSFEGELPLSLSNCVRLIFLDVGVNKLTGNIPAWIWGNISQLHVLGLRSNKFNGTIPLNLCQLNELQVLDLSQNNLHGTIPPCLNNLSAMVQKGIELNNHQLYISHFADEIYTDYSVIGWQGRELEFGYNLRLLKLIDFSSNNLSGEIPNEITQLFELVALNLSRNALQGKVPQQVGQLKSILSLDLSRNRFSGKIPTSLSQLNFLSSLDLSYNEFSGKIPSSTQIQSQDASKFIGNVGLCGPPLISKCLGDESPPTVVGGEDNRGENDDDEFTKWLYIGMASGFVTGFWGICGALLLNRRGRHAFFRFTNDWMDWVYVKIATRKFCR